MRCGDCKGELGQSYNLERIICWDCYKKRFEPEPPPTRKVRGDIRPGDYPEPPPTTEWRTRQPFKAPRIEAIVLAIMAASFSLGFLVGFLVRGSG